ncbi:MAG: putative MFS-type transporter YcaD [Chlamydiia bacterium]|nr:putative MFS-type transporter YcaD [Chlamydiia bacterium]MCH9615313.1 putative MFS-type transporter YcaD [Chlamydiia bacterium]MCH9628365.1 putative MFS-type transporter YcaD [Chlamydiia bacterium]
MGSLFRQIIAPLLSLAFLMLSNGFFITFVSAKLHVEHYSPMMIGVIQGMYYAGFLIGALKSESLIGRIRHIRAFSFFASIATMTVLASGLVSHPIAWVIMRFVLGICIASLYVVIESWLLIIGPVENRGVILGLYMIALYLSQSLSQFIIDFIQIESLMPFLVSGFLAALSILPVTFTRSMIPELETQTGKGYWKFMMVAPMGTIGAAIAGIILGTIYTFIPTYAQTTNISIALIMSITIAGGFLLQYPIGHLSDIISRRYVALGVCVMTIVCCIGVICSVGNETMVLIWSFFLGGFTFTIYPLSITQVADRCSPDDITTLTGVMLFAYSCGAVVGPLIAPAFIHYLGESGSFWCILTSAALMTLIGITTIIFRKGVPMDDQGTFVALPPQTPVSYDLDPRTEEEE